MKGVKNKKQFRIAISVIVILIVTYPIVLYFVNSIVVTMIFEAGMIISIISILDFSKKDK